MKGPARRRLQREYIKRSEVARREKQRRLLHYLTLSGVSEANRHRMAYAVYRQQAFARVSACRHHCYHTGRGHSVYRHFRLTRNAVRRLAHQGHIYGLVKAGW